MRGLITLLAIVLLPFQIMAQSMTVKGVVKDAATGETLPGVNIVVKGTTKGDITDFDGNFTLANVKKGDILVFSYLGYVTQEVVIDKSPIVVNLQESAEKLDEIVVVGYGTQRKKEVTGAVEVVSSETIENLNPTRIEQVRAVAGAGEKMPQKSTFFHPKIFTGLVINKL